MYSSGAAFIKVGERIADTEQPKVQTPSHVKTYGEVKTPEVKTTEIKTPEVKTPKVKTPDKVKSPEFIRQAKSSVLDESFGFDQTVGFEFDQSPEADTSPGHSILPHGKVMAPFDAIDEMVKEDSDGSPPSKVDKVERCLCRSMCLKKPYCKCKRQGTVCNQQCHPNDVICKNKNK